MLSLKYLVIDTTHSPGTKAWSIFSGWFDFLTFYPNVLLNFLSTDILLIYNAPTFWENI